MNESVQSLTEDIELPDNAFMVSSVITLVQYIDEDGRECRALFTRISGERGIGTWQMIGLLELAKTQIIHEHLSGQDVDDDDD